MPNKITYDTEAEALYMYFREAPVERTEERGEDILVDLGTEGLVGIEMLDVDADLSGVIREFGLNPHILDVLNKVKELIPETKRELVLA